MERKTKINAEDGKQEITITREFDLPVELLFKAYEEAEIVEQWMSTKVLKLESKKHGSYQFETTDPMGNKHGFNGTIHEFIPEKRSHARLKWRTRRLIHGLSTWSLNSLQMIPANSPCMWCIARLHNGINC